MSWSWGDSGAIVVPGLIIGDKRLASNLDALRSLGVTHVVNATVDVRNYFEHYDERQGHLKIEYLRCPCHDTEGADMSQHFLASCEFIDRALRDGHSVLVHCQQGISRSSTLLLAFLMHSRQMGLAEAYTLLRSVRMVAKPKANFLRQLVKFGNEIQAARAHAQSLLEAQNVKAAVQENVRALEQARAATAAVVASPSTEAAAVAVAAVSAPVPATAAASSAASPSQPSPPTGAGTPAAASASPAAPGAHSPLEAVNVAPGLFMMQVTSPPGSSSSTGAGARAGAGAAASDTTAAGSGAIPNSVDATEGPRRDRALQQMQDQKDEMQSCPDAAAKKEKRKQDSMDTQTGGGSRAAAAAPPAGADADADPDAVPESARESANHQKRRRIIERAESTAADVASQAQLQQHQQQQQEERRIASASPPTVHLTQLALDQLPNDDRKTNKHVST